MSLHREFEYSELKVSYDTGFLEVELDESNILVNEEGYAYTIELLQEVGKQGWELVLYEADDGLNGSYFFKREVLPNPLDKFITGPR